MGYVSNELSEDINLIINSTEKEDIVHHGVTRPLLFGSFRNSIGWRKLMLSFGVNYRLGHYFRRPSVSYTSVLAGYGGHGDYKYRWIKPGDELITSIPSMPEFSNANRDNFYRLSSVLVERADHIRLQEIRLDYNIGKTTVYIFIDNVGLLWKFTDSVYDPEYVYSNYPTPLNISLGFKTSF